jgi:hypothetical protein
MKTVALAALAVGMLLSTVGSAPAQYYAPGYGNYPYYRDYGPPRPHYRDRERFYGERRGLGGPGGYYRPGRFRSWNGCQPGWTVQDGLCKPYRGF